MYVPSGTIARPVSVHVLGEADVEPVGVSVSPPSGVVFWKATSVDFFQDVLAESDDGPESMSLAERATVEIGSLNCTDWSAPALFVTEGASLTGSTVIETLAAPAESTVPSLVLNWKLSGPL